jgi:hypothetical protein
MAPKLGHFAEGTNYIQGKLFLTPRVIEVRRAIDDISGAGTTVVLRRWSR